MKSTQTLGFIFFILGLLLLIICYFEEKFQETTMSIGGGDIEIGIIYNVGSLITIIGEIMMIVFSDDGIFHILYGRRKGD